MRVCLGIDPGLARVGYGAVAQVDAGIFPVCYGCIETSPAMTFTERLLTIYTSLQTKISVIRPDFAAIERLFFGRNTTTAEYVWQARGAIMLLTAQSALPVVEFTPNCIKRTVCGNGKADKHEIQTAIRDILTLDEIPRPDDTADALAAAVAGLSLYEGG